ncbi:MAG: GTPase Era [Bacillota bacterium]
MTDQVFKSGFVTLIGRPNVGKSTLFNSILDKKVAIMSDKPQTTRNSIRGIYNAPGVQAVFIDTPGIHKPKYKLDQKMMESARNSLAGCDIIFYLIDATAQFGPGEEYILNQLKEQDARVFLVINKIDLLTKEQLLVLIDQYKDRFDFAEIVPVCALSGDNVNRLVAVLTEYLPEGPQYYPSDMVYDQSEQQLIAELIREQILHATRDEIPYAVAVTVSTIEDRPGDRLYIEANIYVDRESQKGIIIGKGGKMLKDIGQAARKEIEKIFACSIYLDLRVKAKKDWRNNEGLLRNWNLLDE